MQLSLRALRYFVATAETGSVTRAARQLGVSQPSISGAIAQIEDDFRVQLFIRHHAKGLSLTPAGERILVEARGLLAHAREFQASAGALGEGLRGEIAVGCFLTLAPFVMPGLLQGFEKLHPEIVVRCEEWNQEEILAGLRTGRIEMALTYAYATSDEFTTEVMAELPPRAILPVDHPLASKRAVSLRDLAAEPMVLLDLPHSREYFLSLFRAYNLEPRVVYRTRSYDMVRGLVGRHRGYGILNAIPRMPYTYDGTQVAAVPILEDLPRTLVVGLRLRTAVPRRAVAAFSKYANEYFTTQWPFIIHAPKRTKRKARTRPAR
ncbi:MAG TPA: LysR family transcriptional regulator [Alphaproteobacteria bacterium]|nr:LysR family transcriptional regulator [Alphaproteobacteria bacterium]